MQEAKIVKGMDGKMKLENLYTPLEEAKKEIWKRWNDQKLKKKIKDFLRYDIPESLRREPKAVVVKPINTPDNEYILFLEMVKKAGLDSISFEFLSDKFTPNNLDKYYLGKLFFTKGKGKRGGDKITTLKIIDFDDCKGKKINKLRTIWGENFVDFHHRILYGALPNVQDKNFDLSDWLARQHKFSQKFYVYYLALFICNGVLFEDFISDSDEEEIKFAQEIVIPSVSKLINNFDLKPLIVRLRPRDNPSKYWWCYPFNVKKFIQCMVTIR